MGQLQRSRFVEPYPPLSPTNIFAPASTPAESIFGLSLFVLAVTAAIFVVVFTLLLYSVVKFRKRKNDDGREPAQVYGSNQVELAWTVIPVLIVVALFLATARVIATVQKTSPPSNAIEVTVIGHQFWWEYRYPELDVVTANELHVPVSDPAHPTPTFLTLLSADTDHSFWVPRLAGKTDLIPNHPNSMWIDPHETGRLPGPVRAILRNAARQDAAACLRPVAGWISTAGFGSNASRRVVRCHCIRGTADIRNDGLHQLPQRSRARWRTADSART